MCPNFSVCIPAIENAVNIIHFYKNVKIERATITLQTIQVTTMDTRKIKYNCYVYLNHLSATYNATNANSHCKGLMS